MLLLFKIIWKYVIKHDEMGCFQLFSLRDTKITNKLKVMSYENATEKQVQKYTHIEDDTSNGFYQQY